MESTEPMHAVSLADTQLVQFVCLTQSVVQIGDTRASPAVLRLNHSHLQR